jgi:hypothetical protein
VEVVALMGYWVRWSLPVVKMRLPWLELVVERDWLLYKCRLTSCRPAWE